MVTMKTPDASNTWNVSQWLIDNQTPGGRVRQIRGVSSDSEWVGRAHLDSKGGPLSKSVDVPRVERVPNTPDRRLTVRGKV